jgi:hypothetical protein
MIGFLVVSAIVIFFISWILLFASGECDGGEAFLAAFFVTLNLMFWLTLIVVAGHFVVKYW